jgi:alpha,alpha-trehalase
MHRSRGKRRDAYVRERARVSASAAPSTDACKAKTILTRVETTVVVAIPFVREERDMVALRSASTSRLIRILFALFSLLTLALVSPVWSWSDPAAIYGDLFRDVQLGRVFADSKRFPDLTPRFSPSEIVGAYAKQKKSPGFDLTAFVAANFDTTLPASDDTLLLLDHIDRLWSYLSRPADTGDSDGSLIPLPHPYVVPGGRFREMYYWDSYFTMLGLAQAGRIELMESMLDDFAYLIDTVGHIPNGNRTYYLSRSQPPFFSLMVALLADVKGARIREKYLPALEKEYRFWMRGESRVREGLRDTLRLVRLRGGEVLNRYWDERCAPRSESYREDVATARTSGRGKAIYRDIRAAAESGWDFSSRWFADATTLKTIHTTDIVPVDLNCLLFHLESMLGEIYNTRNDTATARQYQALAAQRRQAVLKYFWNETRGFFIDYDFKAGRQTGVISAAGLYPLYFRIADSSQAQRVGALVSAKLLKSGGLVTSLSVTGQQWDAPNGWAPLQWMGYVALNNYGQRLLACQLARRWIGAIAETFFETGRLMEKYNVANPHLPGGGGEYHRQDGFGWTNGVFLRLWIELHAADSLGR